MERNAITCSRSWSGAISENGNQDVNHGNLPVTTPQAVAVSADLRDCSSAIDSRRTSLGKLNGGKTRYRFI